MKATSNYEHLIEDDKNKFTVLCQYCNCKILPAKSASSVQLEHKLPLMTAKNEDGVPANDGEDLLEYWLVEDMYTFENIGFTHTVNDIKYLSCADCEMGPVGYHLISSKKSYVALARVKHQET